MIRDTKSTKEPAETNIATITGDIEDGESKFSELAADISSGTAEPEDVTTTNGGKARDFAAIED